MEASAVREADSDLQTLVFIADLPQFTPQVLFDYWICPDLLRQWWPPQAEVEPGVGGRYHFAWPRMDWDLRGFYTAFDPAEQLSFTWKWDHDPEEVPPREVRLEFRLLQSGTMMTLAHGRYTESEGDQQERAGHREGWLHFLGRLAALSPAC